MAGERKAAPRRRKVAIVTGGGTGIGRATAAALADKGFTVCVIGRRPDRLKDIKGKAFHAYPCDIADRAAVDATVKAILRDHKRIDVLVNNAGVIHRQLIDDVTADATAETFAINVFGTMNMSLACLPALRKSKGAVVNLSSTLSQRANPGVAIYAASKGAVESFSRAMANEVAKDGVRINVVSPALVRSEIYLHAMDPKAYAKLLAERGKDYPLGRTGEPEEVAALVAFLATSTWMTGTVVPIDGGKMIG